MNERTTTIEIVANECGLKADDPIIKAFVPLYIQATPLVDEASKITVVDATHVKEMKAARACRLKLRPIRIEADKIREEMKKASIEYGRNVEKVAQTLIKGVKAEEDRLEELEKTAERAEAARVAKLKGERLALLAPFNIDASFYDLGSMPPETFAQLLDNTRLAHESKIAAAKKAEEERAAAEAARIEEEKRVRAENERLRLEAVERDREAKAERDRVAAERDAAEEVARKEREAREKAEAELRAKQEAEKKKAAAEEKARKKAALAPDQDKIRAVAAAIRAIPMPQVTEPAAVDALKEIVAGIERMAAWIEKAASTIGGAD